MTPLAAAAFAVAAAAAVADWWSRWRDDARTERWSKPLTVAALVVAACALDPADPAVRAWFVVGLALSLAGDVLLLDDRRFVTGLAAFLLAHVAYVGGFLAAAPWRWWAFGVAWIGLAVVGVSVGRRIVAGAAAADPALRAPVVAYLAVIMLMVAAAAAAGDGWAVAGAIAFLASDAILGWRKFVAERRWMPVTVMVTYHLAQAALVVSLLA